MDLAPLEVVNGERRPVHDEIDEFRNPADGYSSWCSFIEGRSNFVPTIQIGDLNEFQVQVARLHALGRGLVLRLPPQAFAFAQQISQRLAAIVGDGETTCVIFDFERQNLELLQRQAQVVSFVEGVHADLPQAAVSISASSFPDSFTHITHQDIYERLLFDGVAQHIGEARLIYSDRGSARAERQNGGGGDIPPRVDYALGNRWTFFRAADANNRPAAYAAQALAAMESDGWDPELRLWGTQMIERTALGDLDAISSQARATAARINIHLHRQLFSGGGGAMYQTDEDWTD
jgi:hypothetical protein